MKFRRVKEDLYIYDASNVDVSKLSESFMFLMTTVDENKKLFSVRDTRKADKAVTLNRRTNHMQKINS